LRTTTTKEAVDLSSERKHRRKNLKTPQNPKNSGETPKNRTKQTKSLVPTTPTTTTTTMQIDPLRERERERNTHIQRTQERMKMNHKILQLWQASYKNKLLNKPQKQKQKQNC